MKILSWNLNIPIFSEMVSQSERVCEIILNLDCDVLCLQECSQNIIDILAKSDIYNHVKMIHNLNGYIVILVKKHLMSSTEYIRNEKQSKFFPDPILTVKIGDVYITNVCMTNGNLKGVLSLEQKNLMISKYDKPNSVLIGDFGTSSEDLVCGSIHDIKQSDQDTWYTSLHESGDEISKRHDRCFTNIKEATMKTLTEFKGQCEHVPIQVVI